MKKTRALAEQSRQAAEDRLATLKATAEAAALEHTVRLLESPQPVVVPWQEYPQYDDFNRLGGQPFLWTSRDDRTEGRYRPLYETELDLRKMRADARRLFACFPVAQGAVESLSNYTMGNGFEFEVKPKDAYKNSPQVQQTAALIQPIVDRLLERNEFVGSLDREIHADSRVDGECFIALYPDDRDVRIELVDPDYILEPARKRELEQWLGCGHKLNYWWHGVHTQFNRAMKRDDVAAPLGYHAVFDREGEMCDYLPACRVEHIKRNVGRFARRGVSDFSIVLQDLEAEAKLRRNTAIGAAILAAIVMIREHAEGASKSSIEGMVSANATASYERQMATGSSRTAYGQNVSPGTIKDVPKGMTHSLGPMGSLNHPVYIEVAQYLLRVIGARWNMPEYLISSDASNGNYASTLVAEGPFVKAREHDQAFYASHFERLIWKALAMYHKLGAIAVPWKHLWDTLDVHAEFTSPASRDRKQQADVNKILSDAGILSDRTFASDMGFDYDEELANGAKKAPPPASPFGGGSFGASPFGAPPRMESRRLDELTEQLAERMIQRRMRENADPS